MSLLKFKAKVKELSEDDLELSGMEDALGNMNFKSKEWVWRNVAFPAEHIHRIIEYTQTKTVVLLYQDECSIEKLLIAEPFESVFKKWEDSRTVEQIAEEIINESN